MDLAELIGLHRGTRTYAQLERDSGGTLGAARWQQMATRELRSFPAPQSVTAISIALDVSEETVLLAIATSVGLNIKERPRLADLIPGRAADLSDQCVTAVLAVVRAMCTQEAMRS